MPDPIAIGESTLARRLPHRSMANPAGMAVATMPARHSQLPQIVPGMGSTPPAPGGDSIRMAISPPPTHTMQPRMLATLLGATALATSTVAGDATALQTEPPKRQIPPEAPRQPTPAAEPAQKPGRWRLDAAPDTPDWFRVSGETRWRLESIDGQFRGSPRLDNTDTIGFGRTNLRFDLNGEPLGAEELDFTLEVLDSRHLGAGTGSFLNTTTNNPVDILQAFFRYDLGELGSGTNELRFGRQTLNLGSRRLVARNRFRNTINSFNGLLWHFEDDKAQADIFWFLPTRRQPNDFPSLLDNDVELDRQDKNQQFWGMYYQRQSADWLTWEMYLYGLYEDNESGSRRRELFTPGFRAFRTAAREQWDYEVELILQAGETADRDHQALYAHLEAGYTFDTTWTPRIQAQFDYASGDTDATDNNTERFNTLFGARRWEYGPTGIYGAIARSNLISPDLRVELRPRKNIQWMVGWRGVWLASDTDSWTPAGLRDTTGAAGRHVGQQFETRLRWDLEDADVRLEIGAAYLAHGGFQSAVGNNTDTAYGYFQTRCRF